MRRIVMFNQLSTDGLFAAPDGSLDFVVPDPEQDRAVAASLTGRGALLFGRKTYEMFAHFWPGAAAEADTGAGDAPDPHGPHRSAELLKLARWIDGAEKYVFSRTLQPGALTWHHSHVLPELNAEAVLALKRSEGPDLMLFGSGSIVRALAGMGLIDEYQLMMSPVILGRGRPLFADLQSRVPLELIDAKAHASGNVLLRYRPRGSMGPLIAKDLR